MKGQWRPIIGTKRRIFIPEDVCPAWGTDHLIVTDPATGQLNCMCEREMFDPPRCHLDDQ